LYCRILDQCAQSAQAAHTLADLIQRGISRVVSAELPADQNDVLPGIAGGARDRADDSQRLREGAIGGA